MTCRRKLGLTAVLVLMAMPVSAFQGPGSLGDSLMVGAGRWGVKGGDEAAVAVELEYRLRDLHWGIFPLAGFLANSDQGWSPRLGLGRELRFGELWDATVTFAVAAYFPGQGKDLGHTLEFRSALDLGFRVRPATRLGLSVAHFSNAGLARTNPGIETLSLTVTFYPHRAGGPLR